MNILKVFLVSFIVLSAFPVQANKDALAKAQFMLRQMNAELNQLRAGKQKLLAEKAQLEKDNASLQKKYDKLGSKSKKTKTALKERFAELKKMYKDEVASHKETKSKLSKANEKNKNANLLASNQFQKITLCVANNKKLFNINQNLLIQFEDKSVWDSLIQSEPFSQLSRVEIENLVDDYQYGMGNLRIDDHM